MPGWGFAHVHGDVNPDILRMLEDTFFFLFEPPHEQIYHMICAPLKHNVNTPTVFDLITALRVH